MFPTLIDKLTRHEDLTADEASAAMDEIMAGRAPASHIAAFLVGLAMKGERPIEIVGLARAMRANAVPLSARYDDLIDTCGTGGDRSGTFNISSCAALVVAACGVRVAKHGNRSASSKAGGADVALCASNLLSTQDDVAAALVAEYGISVFARRGVDRDGFYSHLNAVADTHPHLTQDDGCDLVSLLHRERTDALSGVLAGTEETTTGIIRLRAMAGDTEAALGTACTPTLRPLRVGSRVILMVTGEPLDVALYLTAALLERVGTDRLRLCKAPDCGRLFVKIGRREFCSLRCQRRVFLSTYDPFAAVPRRARSSKGSRHGKASRKR